MSIYLDELFIINLVACLFLLAAYSSVFGMQSSVVRRLTAASAGAGIACVKFLFAVPEAVTAAAEAVLPLIAFGRMPLKKLLLLVLIKYAFSGLAVPVITFFGGSAAIIRGGVIYFDISPRIFIAVFSGCCAFTVLTARLLRLVRNRKFYTLDVTRGNKTVRLKALYDSGNLLKNPYDGSGVIIAEKESASALKPEHCILLPYRSLGTDSGLIKAFKADKLYCVETGKTINNVTVGLSEMRLSKNGSIQALAGPGILEEEN